MVAPIQTGELLEAVAVGLALTITVVVALSEQPLSLVTVKVYVPAMAAVAFGIDGDRLVLEKPLGPIQLYEVILSEPPVSCMVAPIQTGELLDAIAVGSGFTVTSWLLVQEQLLASVMVMPMVAVPAAPALQLMELVPWPELMVPPDMVQA
jgi:hypothetical protein